MRHKTFSNETPQIWRDFPCKKSATSLSLKERDHHLIFMFKTPKWWTQCLFLSLKNWEEEEALITLGNQGSPHLLIGYPHFMCLATQKTSSLPWALPLRIHFPFSPPEKAACGFEMMMATVLAKIDGAANKMKIPFVLAQCKISLTLSHQIS